MFYFLKMNCFKKIPKKYHEEGKQKTKNKKPNKTIGIS